MALALQQSAAVAESGRGQHRAARRTHHRTRPRGDRARTQVRRSAPDSCGSSRRRRKPRSHGSARHPDRQDAHRRRQLPELLDQYNAAFERLTPTTRQAVLQQIAGTDAIRALSIAIEGGSEGLEDSIRASNRQGAAADLAAAKTKGLAGAFRAFQSQIQTLGINVGTLLIPVLSECSPRSTTSSLPCQRSCRCHERTQGDCCDIVFTIKVNLPDLPDAPDLFPNVDFDAPRRLLSGIVPLGAGLFLVADAANAAGAGLDALGFGQATAEAQQLEEKIADLNRELFDVPTGERFDSQRRAIQAEISALERSLPTSRHRGRRPALTSRMPSRDRYFLRTSSNRVSRPSSSSSSSSRRP